MPYVSAALVSRRLLLPLCLSVASLAPSLGQAATDYPLRIDNCGRTLVFEQAPERVVSIGQASTEILLGLGLGARIVGTGVWFGPLPPALAAEGAAVPRLADNAPSFEAVAGTRPDIVTAQYTYHLGANGEVATPEQFESLGIPSYVSPSDCENKGVTADSNADGSRSQPFEMALVEREVSELAEIFDVGPHGEALNAALKARIAQARERLDGAAPEPLKVVFWFSSPRLEGDPWVAGSNGVPGYISRTLGLDNVIETEEEWPAVSWERIASLDPDVIVVARMDRRLYPADDAEIKRGFLQRDPVTRELRAVRDGRVLVVDAQALNPSIRVVDGIEMLADQLGGAGVAR
ncbi:ABC transporter substrate-binding protein [Halotalea alkalilenta]|uniref:ABC transporter substrate-binding protein n=1 Tax=Halotalea alkalilenta TaxID=376489 RepID=A0A172YDQ7_9GAMM|nr:ABC transporter substrate-binding protein [Halotalea alkalilenta]ANF57400.1 ABC transporter substrate-binding protein [Halotalea alkalilenta]